jgi:hypothetical protein
MCQKCLDAVRQIWPNISDEERVTLLWGATAYPFSDPEYTARQLQEKFDQSGGNVGMALAIADMETDAAMAQQKEFIGARNIASPASLGLTKKHTANPMTISQLDIPADLNTRTPTRLNLRSLIKVPADVLVGEQPAAQEATADDEAPYQCICDCGCKEPVPPDGPSYCPECLSDPDPYRHGTVTAAPLAGIEDIPAAPVADTVLPAVFAEAEPEPFASRLSTRSSPEASRLSEIQAKQREIDQAACRVDACQESLRDARLAWEALVSELGLLIKQDLEVLPLFDRKPAADETPGIHVAGIGVLPADPDERKAYFDAVRAAAAPGGHDGPLDDDDPTDIHDPTSTPEAWRAVPLAELGLRPKIEEKLIEHGIHTVGQLEDVRADYPAGGPGWPKGIGGAKVAEIEKALVSWRTKWYAEHMEAIEPLPEPAGLTSPTTPAGIAAHDPSAKAEARDSKKGIKARAKELNDGSANCLDSKLTDDVYWVSGQEAHKHGWKLTDCSYVPGVEQDDWLRGWLAAELLEKCE